jgi:ParB family transcriptional regulator, chromosome partitioning protein
MSKKKKFNISPSLTRGLIETINIVENDKHVLRSAVIPLSRIEPDPNNPRKLSIVMADIVNGLDKNDPLYNQKEQERQKLLEVADSIKRAGILNPIVVYKHGDNYRIVAGERRFLASLIAGFSEIEARVYNESPKEFDLRFAQWVENTVREDLNLIEKIGNIKEMMLAYQQQYPNTAMNATWLKNNTGLSLTQASCYMNVLNASADVWQAIQEGVINNVDKAATIAGISDGEIRASMIEACKQGVTLKNLKQLISKTPKNRLKQKEIKVSLGTTKNPKILNFLIDLILNSDNSAKFLGNLSDIGVWKNTSSATMFKKLIKLLEENIK